MFPLLALSASPTLGAGHRVGERSERREKMGIKYIKSPSFNRFWQQTSFTKSHERRVKKLKEVDGSTRSDGSQVTLAK